METGRKASGCCSILKDRKRATASAVGYLLPSTMRRQTRFPGSVHIQAFIVENPKFELFTFTIWNIDKKTKNVIIKGTEAYYYG